jgi:hypothetical protein
LFFKWGLANFYSGWPGTCDLPASSTQVAGITGGCLHSQLHQPSVGSLP